MVISLIQFKNIIENLRAHHFLLLVIALSLFIIWSLLSLLSPNFENYTLKIVSSPLDSMPLFSAIITILATILGIFFSISIIVVQHAASNYTPSILENYKEDPKTWFVFFYYFGSLTLAMFSLHYPKNFYLINIAILTFVFSFLFLASQFVHIIDLIDPRSIIEKAKQQSLKDIDHIPSKLNSLLKEKKPKNDLEKRLMESPVYQQFIFHNEKTLTAVSKNRVLQIGDVILKATNRRELETCIKGLKALSEISSYYVNIRKDDPTSDDDFLQYIYDHLLAIFEIAIDNKDTALLQEIIIAFEEIGSSTTEIKPISVFSGSNQSTKLAIWNIGSLGTKAIHNDFPDVAVQATRSLKKIGELAIQKTGDDGLASEKISEIGILAVLKGDWFITNNAFEGLKELLFNAVAKRINVHKEPSRILQQIEKIAKLGIETGLEHWAFTSLFPILPEYSIQKVSRIAFHVKNEEYPKIETSSREGYSKEIVSRLMETLGKIAIWTSQKNSLFLLGESIDCILRITLSMLKEKLITIENGYNDVICKVIGDLSRAYTVSMTHLLNTEGHSPVPDDITDAVTSIAIYALEEGKEDITIYCVKALHHMCLSIVERDKYGYDTARCAGRIGVIGAYALYKSKSKIVSESLNMLMNFNEVYSSKSLSPQDNLHIDEIRSIYKRFNTEHPLPIEEVESYGNLFKDVSSAILDEFVDLYEKKKTESQTKKN